MQIIVSEVWTGKNYIAVIKALSSSNEELKVRVVGRRLIISDVEAGFYRCIPAGDAIGMIPKREPQPEEPIEIEAIATQRVDQPIREITSRPAGVWSVGGVWELDQGSLQQSKTPQVS